jgi:phage gp36-like protein
VAAYATVDQIRLAVARDPSKLLGSAATLTEEQLDLVLEQAQAEVDGKLRARYVVPFPDPVPELVVSLTIDIACYLAGLVFYQEKEVPDTDPVARRYKRACCLLNDIAAGYVLLDTNGAEQTAASTAWYGTPIDPSGGGWLSREFLLRPDPGWCR